MSLADLYACGHLTLAEPGQPLVATERARVALVVKPGMTGKHLFSALAPRASQIKNEGAWVNAVLKNKVAA